MSEKGPSKTIVAVRIRGEARIRPEVAKTLQLLGLTQKYTASLLPDTPSTAGMLQKVKDHVTWGEADRETLTELLLKRGRVKGKGKVTPDLVKGLFKFNDASEMAEEILEGRTALRSLTDRGLRRVFRLHPPRGGFPRSTKRPFHDGGELGYRGAEIGKLLRTMI